MEGKRIMGQHDEYGKQLLTLAAKSSCELHGYAVEVDYGTEQPARIDGAINGKIAVEIESRTSKQVRGAVLDLICHRYQKKLLLLLPVHMSNVETTAEQCRTAMGRFCDPKNFKVVVLAGCGNNPKQKTDVKRVRNALSSLGFVAAKSIRK